MNSPQFPVVCDNNTNASSNSNLDIIAVTVTLSFFGITRFNNEQTRMS